MTLYRTTELVTNPKEVSLSCNSCNLHKKKFRPRPTPPQKKIKKGTAKIHESRIEPCLYICGKAPPSVLYQYKFLYGVDCKIHQKHLQDANHWPSKLEGQLFHCKETKNFVSKEQLQPGGKRK